MSQRKSERIVNLTILLLSSRRHLPKEKIRESVEGYRDQSDVAFERMFERDKEELRAMGVPLDTGAIDPLFGDEEGYRIRRADFELPPMEFTAAEAAVLGVAAQVWQQASAAESTISALAKLRAAGVEPDVSRLAALQPTVNAPEPAFDVVKEAVVARQPIRFRYRGSDELRTVEPWLLPFRHGAWYLIGHDRGRGERRTFKVSRITSTPQLVGRPGSYQVPDQVDARISLDAHEQTQHALIAVRAGHAPTLRRRGEPVETEQSLPEGFSAWRVPYVRTSELAAELASAAPDVVALSPPAVAQAHRRHLLSVIEAHSGEAPS